MDTIKIGGPITTAPSGPGAAEGHLNGRQRDRTKDDYGNAMGYEPRDYSLMARQVAGAWMIALSIAGLGLALSVNRMDLTAAASAASVHPAASTSDRYPMVGVRNPGSVFYSRANEANIIPKEETDSEESRRSSGDGC